MRISPPLEWSDPPQGTQSFALIVYSSPLPDGGGNWVQWILFNIPAETRTLEEGFPANDSGLITDGSEYFPNSWGEMKYGGPNPQHVQTQLVMPAELVARAKNLNCASIAYTYTEPAVFYDYMLDTSKLALKQRIKNVMHSNGYINPEPLRRLGKYLNAANIDLKSFDDNFYSKYCSGSLAEVLESLVILKKELGIFRGISKRIFIIGMPSLR